MWNDISACYHNVKRRQKEKASLHEKNLGIPLHAKANLDRN